MSKVCIIAWVYGRVQGVGFRYTTQYEAKRLGLTGYAKNLDDGSVEVVACGEEGQVEKINAVVKEWRPAFCACRTGAQRAASSLGGINRFSYPLNTFYRFWQASNFGGLLSRTFRKQSV